MGVEIVFSLKKTPTTEQSSRTRLVHTDTMAVRQLTIVDRSISAAKSWAAKIVVIPLPKACHLRMLRGFYTLTYTDSLSLVTYDVKSSKSPRLKP